jgi:hypothetical protein
MQQEQVKDKILIGQFIQWSVDSADHNIAVIDGKNAFYGMVIISSTDFSFITTGNTEKKDFGEGSNKKERSLHLPICIYRLSYRSQNETVHPTTEAPYYTKRSIIRTHYKSITCEKESKLM